ncbi:MAG: hypothetical protein CVV03_10290 [Firmicutes bacterium HGW-Firmicutes-8]|nr:MAG: hypothetical protein CVV03_10290 [Firmicutes bacterium HGW-Firmicutes-8]
MPENQANHTAQLSSSAESSPSSRTANFLAGPVFDKVMAVIGILPFLLAVYLTFRTHTLGIVPMCLIIHYLLFAVTMLVRRTAVRITTNPLYWLLTLIATYWLWLTGVFINPGAGVIPHWCSIILAILGMAIAVYSRISLGRNIGLVPAQRQLVTTGAYGLVRHPIYTGVFINYLAFALDSYSPGNVVLAVLGVFWYVIKSIVEERFLAADPEYAAYMQRVRWRFLPWIV